MISEWKRRGVVTKICLKEKAKNTALPVEKILQSHCGADPTNRVHGTAKCDWTMVTAWRLINIVFGASFFW
jgi:hypothetical protein